MHTMTNKIKLQVDVGKEEDQKVGKLSGSLADPESELVASKEMAKALGVYQGWLALTLMGHQNHVEEMELQVGKGEQVKCLNKD